MNKSWKMETLVILLQLIHRLLNINQVFLKNQDAKGVLRNVKIAGPLKYLSIFWRSLEIPLINCKMLLGLTIVLCVILMETQNYVLKLLLYQPNTTQNWQNN